VVADRCSVRSGQKYAADVFVPGGHDRHTTNPRFGVRARSSLRAGRSLSSRTSFGVVGGRRSCGSDAWTFWLVLVAGHAGFDQLCKFTSEDQELRVVSALKFALAVIQEEVDPLGSAFIAAIRSDSIKSYIPRHRKLQSVAAQRFPNLGKLVQPAQR
jgi:hypothetical protein